MSDISVLLNNIIIQNMIMLDKRSAELRDDINQLYRASEFEVVMALLNVAQLKPPQNQSIRDTAIKLIVLVRATRHRGIDYFLTQYALTSEEGIALMCLAEALLL